MRGLATTAGSVSLVDNFPAADATQVRRIHSRQGWHFPWCCYCCRCSTSVPIECCVIWQVANLQNAGAIMLAKTDMGEFAISPLESRVSQ